MWLHLMSAAVGDGGGVCEYTDLLDLNSLIQHLKLLDTAANQWISNKTVAVKMFSLRHPKFNKFLIFQLLGDHKLEPIHFAFFFFFAK